MDPADAFNPSAHPRAADGRFRPAGRPARDASAAASLRAVVADPGVADAEAAMAAAEAEAAAAEARRRAAAKAVEEAHRQWLQDNLPDDPRRFEPRHVEALIEWSDEQYPATILARWVESYGVPQICVVLAPDRPAEAPFRIAQSDDPVDVAAMAAAVEEISASLPPPPDGTLRFGIPNPTDGPSVRPGTVPAYAVEYRPATGFAAAGPLLRDPGSRVARGVHAEHVGTLAEVLAAVASDHIPFPGG